VSVTDIQATPGGANNLWLVTFRVNGEKAGTIVQCASREGIQERIERMVAEGKRLA
jgi:hypothetical protein